MASLGISRPAPCDALLPLRARSQDIDAAVTELWAKHVDPIRSARSALLAVGGYGREEQFLHSDVDLLILEEPGTFAPGALSDFLRELWDRGYRASHSVHPVSDCKRMTPGNFEFNISLLDRRYLAGHRALFLACEDACRKPPPELKKALAEMTNLRHEKFQFTIQNLEPDVKEGPGGLRDLNVIRWMKQLGLDVEFDEFEAVCLLAEIREGLHRRAKRDMNILRFEDQDALSEGYAGGPAEWMRDYYRAAKAVFAACREEVDRVLDQKPGLRAGFLDFRTRLSNEDFTVSREQILLRNPARLAIDSTLAHKLFVFQARHGLRLARDTRKRIEGGSTWNWPQWKEVLSLPHAAAALRSMMDTGELLRQIPEWKRVDCLVARDFFHRYTVDEHTIIALENLERSGATNKRFQPLWEACENKAALRFALLLHDIGKGEGEDHDRKSVEIAKTVGARLGIPAAEQQLIERLIADHLYLGHLLQTRDVDEKRTAGQAAQHLRTEEYLSMLTLLTHADSSAVFPGAMTAWRESQLWHAYNVIGREFTKELEDDRIPAKDQSKNPVLAEFLEGFPMRYWFRSSSEERERHSRMATEAAITGIGLELIKRDDAWQLTVVTKDRARLLADLAGVLASFGVNILKAEAFGNARGVVLDIFVFSDPMKSLDLNLPVVEELKDAVRRVVTGKESAERLMRRKPKFAPKYRVNVKTILRFDNEASGQATLLELIASDRPGLLYDVARSVADCGCQIDTVLLNTEGQRAVDVFYLRSGSSKLEPETIETVGRRLAEVI
jgi:[protein-PII] uridylyltransferase